MSRDLFVFVRPCLCKSLLNKMCTTMSLRLSLKDICLCLCLSGQEVDYVFSSRSSRSALLMLFLDPHFCGLYCCSSDTGLVCTCSG